MSHIKIKHFGPIQEGCLENDGWIEAKRVTVFIGNQGSGKSTVAKLISTMSWIEKAIVSGVLNQKELNTYNRFIKQLAYHHIDKYITEKTVIQYKGKAFSFHYMNGNFTATESATNGYELPQIMYAPAERTLLSVFDRPDKLKNLPLSLYAFNEAFDAAKRFYAEGLRLPINNVNFEYDRLNKIAHIVGGNSEFRMRLSEASSGFQSTVPLYLVTMYLSDRLSTEENPMVRETSLEEQKKIDREVKAIMEDIGLDDDVRRSLLRQISAKRKPVCLLNIVEEPEQNLFPSSQRSVLNELLRCANQAVGNKLILTTHSPYLISYLTHAVKAYTVLEQIKSSKKTIELTEKLNEVVPQDSTVSPSDWVVYELNEADGTIITLKDYHGLPSDANYLNERMAEGNEIFGKLLDIEDLCQ